MRHVGRTSFKSLATATTVAILLSAVMADTSSADIIWLPVAAVDSPLTVCRGGMTEAEATAFALDFAERSGFYPPPGATEPEILLLERMTAEAADRINDFLQLTTSIPRVDPWECVWVVELRGRKRIFGGRPDPFTPTPGPTPPPVYWENMRFAFHDTKRDVYTISLSSKIDPTPSPTLTPDTTPTPSR